MKVCGYWSESGIEMVNENWSERMNGMVVYSCRNLKILGDENGKMSVNGIFGGNVG